MGNNRQGDARESHQPRLLEPAGAVAAHPWHEAQAQLPLLPATGEGSIPTGEILKTAGNPFDFSDFKAIGRDIEGVPGGYDHNLVIRKRGGDLDLLGTVRVPSGRTMEVHTTIPGVQLYTANFLDGTTFAKHGGFCLETQWFPDA